MPTKRGLIDGEKTTKIFTPFSYTILREVLTNHRIVIGLPKHSFVQFIITPHDFSSYFRLIFNKDK